MQLIGAALERQVHAAGAGVADLGVVGRGLDLELLDGIGGRLDADARLRHDVARSVDGELAVEGAGHGSAAQVVVVHGPLQGVRALERRAGHQPRQAVGVPSPSGISLMSLLSMTWPIDALAGLELRALPHHEHLLRTPRRLQGHVELQALADAHLHVGVLPLLKSSQLDRHRVAPG